MIIELYYFDAVNAKKLLLKQACYKHKPIFIVFAATAVFFMRI